jgi:phospholipid transport system substrate-binding protein
MAADSDWAVAFIRRVGWQLADILARPGTTQDREASLRGLIDQVIDVDNTARFCLGRFWSRASPRQQQRYVALFHDVLMRTILTHIGQESRDPGAIQLSVETAYANQDEVFVPMVITRGGLPPFRVTWAVTGDARDPRIVDVMAEQVSLRITIRSDFSAYLTRHNGDIDAFLEALRHQACVGCGGTEPGNR